VPVVFRAVAEVVVMRSDHLRFESWVPKLDKRLNRTAHPAQYDLLPA